MAVVYSGRHSRPVGVGRHGFGGAGLNMAVEALAGETDIITTFDDFNQIVTAAAAPGGVGGLAGWTATALGGGVAESSSINDRGRPQFESSLLADAGTTDNDGINLQLVGDNIDFPHIWYPDDAPAVAMDNTVFIFACRIGVACNVANGWNGKAFIGYAGAGDTSILDLVTGAITVGSLNGLIGFHVAADGSIDFVSQRNTGVALVLNTNFIEVFPPGSANNATVDEPTWFDLAFRLHMTDMDDGANNGEVRAYFRRVPGVGDDFGVAGAVAAGLRETQASDSARVTTDGWRQHPTVLLNQNPNPATGLSTTLAPTIEVVNGVGPDCDVLVDWWAMGISRFSRRFI